MRLFWISIVLLEQRRIRIDVDLAFRRDKPHGAQPALPTLFQVLIVGEDLDYGTTGVVDAPLQVHAAYMTAGDHKHVGLPTNQLLPHLLAAIGAGTGDLSLRCRAALQIEVAVRRHDDVVRGVLLANVRGPGQRLVPRRKLQTEHQKIPAGCLKGAVIVVVGFTRWPRNHGSLTNRGTPKYVL